jgi:hypothetical protein
VPTNRHPPALTSPSVRAQCKEPLRTERLNPLIASKRLLQQNRPTADMAAAQNPARTLSLIFEAEQLERRHEGRAFIQHGQNRVSGLGRKHQDHPINAGVTVAF